MVDVLTLSLGITQILVQVGAVYLAYRLTKVTGAFLAWSLIIIALILMTGRRVTALMIEAGSIPAFGGNLAFVDRILLPAVISILLFIAMYNLVRISQLQSRSATGDTPNNQ